METLTRTTRTQVSIKSEKVKKNTAPAPFWENAEKNRFGITPMVLLVVGIIGGIAAASGIMDSWVKLAAVAFPSTVTLALILSVAPMRAIVISSVVAIFIDLLVIMF